MSSWNPFSKFSSSKQKVLPLSDVKEFEKLREDLFLLEKACKKLNQDLKKYFDSLTALSKCQTRMACGLWSVDFGAEPSLPRIAEIWNKTADQQEASSSDLTRNLKQACSDPLKRYLDTFPLWNNALKRWDNNLQEYAKVLSKAEKLQSKDRSGPNAEKLEQLSAAVESSREEFESHHKLLKEELKQFQRDRPDYLLPCFDALIQYQLSYFAENESIMTALCRDVQADSAPASDEAYKRHVQQKLHDIKSLSIVVAD